MSEQKIKDSKNLAISLTNTEISEVENAFKDAKDFREVGEKITAPIDQIISKTAEMIDKDPIMNISGELESMNNQVQEVYGDIINNDGSIMRVVKSIPLIGGLAKSLDKKLDEASFNIKGVEGKINVIFSGFDTSYNSLNSSIDMQKEFLEAIEQNIGKVVSYKDFVGNKIAEFSNKLEETEDSYEKEKLTMFITNVEFFQSNLVVLIGNLDMAAKRLMMRLDSANKLSLAMNSSRPVFKTLLSTALIETSSQKAIDASIKAIGVMGSTIDKMSSELTDKAIESSKKSEELSSKPVLSSSVFIENVTKLKNHFDEIDDFRERIKLEALAERNEFEGARKKLEAIKLLNTKDVEEFNNELKKAA